MIIFSILLYHYAFHITCNYPLMPIDANMNQTNSPQNYLNIESTWKQKHKNFFLLLETVEFVKRTILIN